MIRPCPAFLKGSSLCSWNGRGLEGLFGEGRLRRERSRALDGSHCRVDSVPSRYFLYEQGTSCLDLVYCHLEISLLFKLAYVDYSIIK